MTNLLAPLRRAGRIDVVLHAIPVTQTEVMALVPELSAYPSILTTIIDRWPIAFVVALARRRDALGLEDALAAIPELDARIQSLEET